MEGKFRQTLFNYCVLWYSSSSLDQFALVSIWLRIASVICKRKIRETWKQTNGIQHLLIKNGCNLN